MEIENPNSIYLIAGMIAILAGLFIAKIIIDHRKYMRKAYGKEKPKSKKS